jgi:aspartyl-tRNA(Asn)/glutamyl-tRNA(Gln) amidotransferase subunit A
LTGTLFLTAHELAEHFARRRLSPIDLLQATLARAAEVQPELNPFRVLYSEGALEAARQSERRWSTGASLSPLDGVPIGIKDNQAVAGQTRMAGSRATNTRPL